MLFKEYVRGEPVVLTRAAASKKALSELAPKARYLHIATHGWFAPETVKSMRDGGEQEVDPFGRGRSWAV